MGCDSKQTQQDYLNSLSGFRLWDDSGGGTLCVDAIHGSHNHKKETMDLQLANKIAVEIGRAHV